MTLTWVDAGLPPQITIRSDLAISRPSIRSTSSAQALGQSCGQTLEMTSNGKDRLRRVRGGEGYHNSPPPGRYECGTAAVASYIGGFTPSFSAVTRAALRLPSGFF